MLIKACVAVPLARMGGAVLQRAGWEEEQGYYVGIGGVSLLIFFWLVADAAAMYKETGTDQKSAAGAVGATMARTATVS